MRIYSIIAKILSTTASDVCAVTCDIDLENDPPQFDLLFAKNEDISGKDEDNAKRLINILKKYASAEDSTGFFLSIFELIYHIQFAKWKKFANSLERIGKKIHPLLEKTVTTILAMGIKTNFDDTDDDLPGDTFLRHQARKRKVEPLTAVLVNVAMTLKLARRMIDTDEMAIPQLMIDLSAICNVLVTSKLFRNMATRSFMPRRAEDLGELFDEYATIGSFWSGIDILREHCVTDRYREGLQKLRFRGVNQPTGGELRKIKNRFGLDITEKRNTPEGKNHALNDFYDLVTLRLKTDRPRLNGPHFTAVGREDWVRQYPELDNLPMDDPAEIMHAEVKMGLYLLARGHMFPRAIGISKSPCFLCRNWFVAVSTFCKGDLFRIPTSHEKVYAGWKRTGIEQLDSYVSAKMWEAFDRLMRSVRHVEITDATVPTYRMAMDVVEKVCQFQDLKDIYLMYGGWKLGSDAVPD